MEKRILIIDDDAHIRLLLQRTLEPLALEGVSLSAAEDGDEGLRMAAALKPDLIFLDVIMPGRSGLEVCRALRQMPDLIGTHIVILTARGQRLPTMEAGVGPHELLTKPFDPDQILNRAAEVLAIDLEPAF